MRKYKRQCQQARANLMKLIEADREAEHEEFLRYWKPIFSVSIVSSHSGE